MLYIYRFYCIGYSLIIYRHGRSSACNVCLLYSDVYKARNCKLYEAGSACPGCMGTRLQSGYVVPRYHTCTLECERIDCEPYMARSRDKIGLIWLTSGQATHTVRVASR